VRRSFKEKVLSVVSKIQKGKVLTYKEVSGRVGRYNREAKIKIKLLNAEGFNSKVF